MDKKEHHLRTFTVFSDNGGETMEEKILRMIRNEVPSSENLYFAKHFREYQLLQPWNVFCWTRM